MGQQLRVQQQQVVTEQRAVDRQAGHFENRTRALIETYSDVIDESDGFTDLLPAAIAFDDILRETQDINASNNTEIVDVAHRFVNIIDRFEIDLQQRRINLFIQQIRVAS